MNPKIEDLSPTDVIYQPRLVFIIGDFEKREELRKGVYHFPNWSEERFEDDKFTSRWDWVEGTFAADHHPNESNPLKRVNAPQDAFYLFRARNRVLLIALEIQESIRSHPPVSDQYGELEVSKHGGIIPYNHFLARSVKIDGGKNPSVLSMVVEEKPPADFNLENAVSGEFKYGADVFLVGLREPEEYRRLVNAWSGGTVNPANYRRARFNQERFTQGKGGVLVPKHNY